MRKKSSKCSKTYEADGSLINLIMNHVLLFNSNTTAVFLKLPLSPLRHVALTSVSVKYVPTISSGWLTVLWWVSVQRAIGANSNTLHKQHLQHSLGESTYDNGWKKGTLSIQGGWKLISSPFLFSLLHLVTRMMKLLKKISRLMIWKCKG